MEETLKPRVKVMCVFENNGKTLAIKLYDKDEEKVFYRLVGGSLEFGETIIDGVRREIREELHSEINNLLYIKVVENIFTYENKPGHEIVFIYKAELADKELYAKEKIHIIEPYGEFDAEWVSIDGILEGKTILYPATNYSEIFKS